MKSTIKSISDDVRRITNIEELLERMSKIEPIRLEIIDETGRAYVKYGIKNLEYSIQDNNQTLKIFVNT